MRPLHRGEGKVDVPLEQAKAPFEWAAAPAEGRKRWSSSRRPSRVAPTEEEMAATALSGGECGAANHHTSIVTTVSV